MLRRNNAPAIWTVTIGAAGALMAAALVMLSGDTRSDVVDAFRWIWYMTHEDQYGLIGTHLEPGREYYFPPSAPYYDRDYFQVKPVSAEETESKDVVAIGVVRADQKIDHEYGFRRTRVPYLIPVHAKELKLVVNGDYFFSLLADDTLGDQITIDRALRERKYVKVSIYLQKLVKAELVAIVSETHIRFTYWPTTRHRKERFAYSIDEGRRTDFRDCFAESDGAHAVCPNSLKKP